MIQLVVAEDLTAAHRTIWAPEFQLREHASVELVYLARIRCECLAAFWFFADHFRLLSASVTYDVLTGLALDWVSDDVRALWADKILVEVNARGALAFAIEQ